MLEQKIQLYEFEWNNIILWFINPGQIIILPDSYPMFHIYTKLMHPVLKINIKQNIPG